MQEQNEEEKKKKREKKRGKNTGIEEWKRQKPLKTSPYGVCTFFRFGAVFLSSEETSQVLVSWQSILVAMPAIFFVHEDIIWRLSS